MLLETVRSPADLKKLTIPQLTTVAEEIRQLILNTICQSGGHVSSNLGVVELTLALHYVFDTPNDKIVWDVGHQCYPHKIITGRQDRFSTIRQNGGLSGFPSRTESDYDTFDTGHASNSISVAVGLAEAKRRTNADYHAIAVIGDGSLTGGMAFEALNHAGHLKSDVIVVLNDNEMSISQNVGALSAHLNRLMTGEFVSRVREEIKSKLRALDDKVYKAARYFEEAVKGLVTPGILFEELGFQYVGPLDGHNLTHLIENFRNVKRLKGPILVHVVTKKGKGYEPAECDAARFHGIGKFDLETGKSPDNANYTYTDVFGETMLDLAKMDERVIAVTAAMCLGTGLETFSQVYPDRFYDIGIAEAHGVTFAGALALQGLRPYVAIYSTFLQRAYDQVIQDVCLQGLPVTFALDRSGIVGQDGPTHHGNFDMSYLRHIPNMVVMCPKDENELRQMLYSAHQYEKPCSIRYPRGEAMGVPRNGDFVELPFGKWEVLREGDDLAIFACGPLVYQALLAARDLDKEGIHCAVVNGRFIKPMDREVIVSHAKRVLTLEEGSVIGGFGSGVMEVLSDEGMGVPVKRMGVPDRFLPHGTQGMLRGSLGLDKEGIAKTVRHWLKTE